MFACELYAAWKTEIDWVLRLPAYVYERLSMAFGPDINALELQDATIKSVFRQASYTEQNWWEQFRHYPLSLAIGDRVQNLIALRDGPGNAVEFNARKIQVRLRGGHVGHHSKGVLTKFYPL